MNRHQALCRRAGCYSTYSIVARSYGCLDRHLAINRFMSSLTPLLKATSSLFILESNSFSSVHSQGD